MADKSVVECPQCGQVNEPVEDRCASCGLNLEWALERGSQYWSEDTATRPPLILVSDDEPGLLRLIAKILESNGYRVVKTPDAYITLELVERLHPDLIITDIGKPGMSGIEMISRLKADPTLRDIPAIVASTHADKESVREATEAGAIRFLSKPFSPSDLTAAVASVLGEE